MPFTVAIVGRPNVGKSTLFNRLIGRKVALVDDEPGVTRDRREGDAALFGLTFRVVDTAGLEEAFDDSLEARMRRQTEIAVRDADLVLLLIDAVSGVLPLDEHFARWLRRDDTPVALVANKCESKRSESGLGEAYGLGLGDPIPISAEHGVGMSDLARAIAGAMDEAGFLRDVGPDELARAEIADNVSSDGAEDEAVEDDTAEEDTVEEDRGPLQIAIVGRPNVGKSTLINRLIQEDRLLTGPEAGITRDSITIEWDYKGWPVKLIDTAGLRRRAKVNEKLEKLSAGDSRRSIDFAHVVVLLLDAENPLEKQDLTIARQVIDEGRALVIAVNKWDSCADRPAAMQALLDRVQRSLPQIRGVPVVTLSALQDRRFDKLMDAVLAAYRVWNKRISTAQLNRWLESVTAIHPPPAVNGRRIRLKYMTQAKARPPTFALFSSLAGDLPTSYLRYLENGLRESFGLSGCPIRLTVRKAKNPYAPAKRR